MIKPEVIEIDTIKLCGMRIRTTLAENRASELWQSFKPRVKEIGSRKGMEFYSVHVYPDLLDFAKFDNSTVFDKWAAVKISKDGNLPQGMESFTLSGGIYARFMYRGTIQDFYKVSREFYGEWLPKSNYELDARPHFEIMDERYLGPMNKNSEEEVWVPIKEISRTPSG